MRDFLKCLPTILVVFVLFVGLSGCTVIFQKGRRSDLEEIISLKQRLNRLEQAKIELESRLKKEIEDKEVSVLMKDRGLVITFVAEVLFDSGKAELRPTSLEKLDKVASVLNTTVKDSSVGIEGHTDDLPIKYSNWKSNWELSATRALSVLHYFSETNGMDQNRLSATGYGEYRPMATNTTLEGRQQNRRVEIVILPSRTTEGR